MPSVTLRLEHRGWHSLETPGGRLHWIGSPDTVEQLAAALAGADASAISAVGGHWAAVLETPGRIVAAIDFIRSWPLFVASRSHGSRVVTDDIAIARSEAGDPPRDERGAREFLQLSYVTGSRTLFQGIRQMQAGERLQLGADGTSESTFFRRVGHANPGLVEDAGLDRAFSGALDRVFDRLFSRIGNRQVVIPLSGGLDSRLLAVAMRDRGHRNVVNFTYGVGPTREVEISEEVASALGQRWEFIQYTPDEIRAAWASEDAGRFIRESHTGSSLPHIQDWYPVQQLQCRRLIDADAVFLPGHTIVGNVHDEWLVDEPGPVEAEKIVRAIIGHHDDVQVGAPMLDRDPIFVGQVLDVLERIGYDGSPAARLDAVEYWNMLERQAKYINNSMRNYEYFGYEWALPMLDREMLDVWDSFGPAIARDREWYRGYVNRRYSAATGSEINTFEAFAAERFSQSDRERIKKVLRALGIERRIEREITARAIASHPMGFQAFVADMTPTELRRFVLRGGNPMGIYNEKFLADTWNPFARVFSG